jgi:hypothetical protein
MNKISDYVFRQLFPNFNLRPVGHVLFPSHPFFLKADVEEKDGIFTFSLKQPEQDAISIRFRLSYKVDKSSLAAGVLVAYLQLIDRDIESIQKIITADVFDPDKDTDVFTGCRVHHLPHACIIMTAHNYEKELESNLRVSGFHKLYRPLSEKLKGMDVLNIKSLSITEIYGFHEYIGIATTYIPYFKEGKAFHNSVSAIYVGDPEDQSSSYAFANKILNPPLVNK